MLPQLFILGFFHSLSESNVIILENKHKNLALVSTPPLHYYQLVARRIPTQPTFLAFLKYLPSVEIQKLDCV
jgi:hypothetical protein